MGSGGGDRVDMSIVGSLKRRCNWNKDWRYRERKGQGDRGQLDKVGGDSYTCECI